LCSRYFVRPWQTVALRTTITLTTRPGRSSARGLVRAAALAESGEGGIRRRGKAALPALPRTSRRAYHGPPPWPRGSRMMPRLKFRLSAPAMAVSCLPLLVGLFVAWDVHRSQRSASEALGFNVRSVRAAEELAIGIRDLRAHLDRFLLSGDAA